MSQLDRQVQIFITKLSWLFIILSSFTLLLLYLQIPQTCLPTNLKLPKSSCDFPSRHLVPLEAKNKRLWSSKTWLKTLNSYTSLFNSLKDQNFLHNNSKSLCVSSGAGHDVMALNNLGVSDVTGVELIESLPLVTKADPHNLPFFNGSFDFAFSARFDEALFPVRFVSEMERTVNGVCVIAVEECGDVEVMQIVGLFRNSDFVKAFNVSLIGSRWTSIVMKTRGSQ